MARRSQTVDAKVADDAQQSSGCGCTQPAAARAVAVYAPLCKRTESSFWLSPFPQKATCVFDGLCWTPVTDAEPSKRFPVTNAELEGSMGSARAGWPRAAWTDAYSVSLDPPS